MNATVQEARQRLVQQPRSPHRRIRWTRIALMLGCSIIAFCATSVWYWNSLSPEERAAYRAAHGKPAQVVEEPTQPAAVSEIKVTRAEYGDAWPYLRYDEATIRCDKPKGLAEVTIQVGEGVFGLNGTAMGVGGHPDERFLRDTTEYGTPKPIPSDWIQRGLALCGE